MHGTPNKPKAWSQKKTAVLELPVQKQNVMVPVVELFLS